MFARAHVLVGRDQVEFLAQVALHDRERIAGGPGFVHDEDRGRALARSLFELVGPAAVVGHRVALERLRVELGRIGRIGHRRIVDEDEDRLALDVHVLEVVPVEFGRFDAIAGEHHVGVLDRRAVGHVFGPRHDIVGPLERLLLRALRHRQRLGLGAGDADERNLLHVGAVRISRLQVQLLELILDVFDGELFAFRAGCAPFVFVRGQHLDVLEDLSADRSSASRRPAAVATAAGCCGGAVLVLAACRRRQREQDAERDSSRFMSLHCTRVHDGILMSFVS